MATEPPTKQPFRPLHLSSPNMHGDDVKDAQKALHDDRYMHGGFHPGKVDGHYGDHTAAATRRAKYWLGFPKRTWTGPRRFDYRHKLHRTLVGERKLHALERRRRARRLAHAAKSTPGVLALDVAHTQIGNHEEPSGSNMQKYGEWYHMNGVPWCAIFVSWCFDQARPFTAIKWVQFRYSYVPFVVGDAKAGRRGLSVVAKSGVRRGDVVTFDWEGDGTADHIGFFNGWINQSSGTFHTVEGNTSAGSNSNGGQVQARERSIGDVRVFVRVTTL